MNVKSISIRRIDDYGYGKIDPTKPFVAQIEVESPFGAVKLNIDPERTKAIVAVIADLVAEAGRQTAEAMTSAVINGGALLTSEAA